VADLHQTCTRVTRVMHRLCIDVLVCMQGDIKDMAFSWRDAAKLIREVESQQARGEFGTGIVPCMGDSSLFIKTEIFDPSPRLWECSLSLFHLLIIHQISALSCWSFAWKFWACCSGHRRRRGSDGDTLRLPSLGIGFQHQTRVGHSDCTTRHHR
jgi:hypothetical protein